MTILADPAPAGDPPASAGGAETIDPVQVAHDDALIDRIGAGVVRVCDLADPVAGLLALWRYVQLGDQA
jgi:hypothetical protein